MGTFENESDTVVDMIEKELRQTILQAALNESAGAWSDEDHLDLMSVDDVVQYVRRLREGGMPRSWDEIAE